MPALSRQIWRWLPLFLITSLSLFMELAVIRWISGEVLVFTYFKNLSILAAFLGLSIGFALVGKGRDHRATFAPIFGAFVALVLAGSNGAWRVLIFTSGGEFYWNISYLPIALAAILPIAVIIAFFLLITLLFIPLGQATGDEMARHAPVPAYIVNLAASLAGIWAFSLVSYLKWPPAVWFGLALAGIGAYYAYQRILKPITVLIFIATLVGVAFFGRQVIWSPYNRLTVSDLHYTDEATQAKVRVGYVMDVQQTYSQEIIDLSPEFIATIASQSASIGEKLTRQAFIVDLPYRLKPAGSRVLVVGAGMGNDVAAALRNGASRIVAVEIDPGILEIGDQLHPEQPYANPRVVPIVDDARSFSNKNAEKFDVIVYGLLDSHTLLSGLSNVRLDSFVYTLESFEQARQQLKEGGIVALRFWIGAPWVEERLGRMLSEVFGPQKIFVHAFPNEKITTFIVGDISPEQSAQFTLKPWQAQAAYAQLTLPTDDWPYLYLRGRNIPGIYWQTLALIAVCCLLLVVRVFPEALRPQWHFWFLGAAFLLIEFKSITELALLFGTTWLVNALAMTGVLMMALIANLIVLWRPKVNLLWVYGLLFASLGLSYFFPLHLLTGLHPIVKAVISTSLLSLPLLFAGLIFSESLRKAGQTAGPLASNFSGSVAGGFFEYGSIWWGIKSLYIIAIVLYAGALLASRIQKD